MVDVAPPVVPQGSRFALVVLVVLVVLSPWPFGGVHLRATQAVALVSLLTALAAFAWDSWHGRLQLPSRGMLWPFAGLWALAAFQLVPLPEPLHRWIAPGSAFVWHPDVPAAAAVLGTGAHPISIFPDATRRWLAFATGVVALALAAAPALRARRHLLRASVAIVCGGVAVAVCGLVGRLVFGNKLYGVFSVPTVAPFGPFVSKNHFAGYVELAALIAVGLASGLADEARRAEGWLSWIESRRAKWVVLAWGAALLLILAVPASLSRGGFVSLAAGLLAFAVLRLWTRRGSRPAARGVAGGLALGLVLVVGLTAVLPSEARDRVLSLAGISTEHSGAYRLGVWRDTLSLIGSSPLVGSGFGSYVDALPRFKTAAGNLRVEHAESDWLELLAEGGTLALLLVVAVVALGFASWRRRRTEESRLGQALGSAAIAGLVTLLVHGAVDFNMRIPACALVAAVLLGLFAGDGAVSSHRPLGGRLETVAMGAIVAATIGLGTVATWTAGGNAPGLLRRIPASTEKGLRHAGAHHLALDAARHRPADATAWLTLGWLRISTSRAEATALLSWALELDPADDQLRRAAQSMRDTRR
jgi:O-antigen ligase